MTWAHRLKRVFPIDICRECSGAVKVMADIEDPAVIRRILDHLKEKENLYFLYSREALNNSPILR